MSEHKNSIPAVVESTFSHSHSHSVAAAVYDEIWYSVPYVTVTIIVTVTRVIRYHYQQQQKYGCCHWQQQQRKSRDLRLLPLLLAAPPRCAYDVDAV